MKIQEEIKKTAEAHGELSEQEAEKNANQPKEVTEKMLEKEIKKEEILDEKLKEEIIKEIKVEKNPVRGRRGEKTREEIVAAWDPKTLLGKEVREGKVKHIDEIINNKRRILESEIVDKLLNVKADLISIGQSKGKFGGGKRRAWRQTQRKTKEGNVPTFSTMAVVGDEKGHIGIGVGKSNETLPARDKAVRMAKLNVIKVTRGCGSFDCTCSDPHSIPFQVEGKAGSVRVRLIPAPQGTGLVVANELKKLLKLVGIKDVFSKTFGIQRTSYNLMKACMDALQKTNKEYKK